MPMIAEVVELLRCPLTHLSLAWVDAPTILALNDRISSGTLHHVDGSQVRNPITTALISSCGSYVYPVKDDIIVLLPSLAIVTGAAKAAVRDHEIALQKKQVMDFYEQIGWSTATDGVSEDAARFEDLRPVAKEYIHACHMRLKQYISEQGDYLLDIASGPIQYPEYLTYSSTFKYRICADISLRALYQAREKLGSKGIYLLCDITNIPLKDNTMDAFVSLHTVYHLPADEQILAISELHRVLANNRSGAIVYSWGGRSLLMKTLTALLSPFQSARKALQKLTPQLRRKTDPFLRSISRRLNSAADSATAQAGAQEELPLYFHAHGYSWYKQNVSARFDSKIACWRSTSVPFQQSYIHERFIGRHILALLYRLENQFPTFFGRFGQYPVFAIRK